MPPIQTLPKILITIGALLIAIGFILWLSNGRLHFNWFGRLPGDIHIEGQGFSFYAPMVSMLLASVVLSLFLWVVRYIWNMIN